MAWDERSCARRCRNVWLLDVRIVYGNDHVELRRLLRESRNWLVIGDLPYLAWVNDGYTMGTDDRAIRQYIETQSRILKRGRGVRKIYYLIISSSFSDEFDDLIGALKMESSYGPLIIILLWFMGRAAGYGNGH
jgi:hypothetical protein